MWENQAMFNIYPFAEEFSTHLLIHFVKDLYYKSKSNLSLAYLKGRKSIHYSQ